VTERQKTKDLIVAEYAFREGCKKIGIAEDLVQKELERNPEIIEIIREKLVLLDDDLQRYLDGINNFSDLLKGNPKPVSASVQTVKAGWISKQLRASPQGATLKLLNRGFLPFVRGILRRYFISKYIALIAFYLVLPILFTAIAVIFARFFAPEYYCAGLQYAGDDNKFYGFCEILNKSRLPHG
jgi:hypothetical protein